MVQRRGPPSVASTVSNLLPAPMTRTVSSKPQSRSLFWPTIIRIASFLVLAILGPSCSPGMVALLESSPVVQALPTKLISRISPRIGGLRRRSSPSTLIASFIGSSNKWYVCHEFDSRFCVPKSLSQTDEHVYPLIPLYFPPAFSVRRLSMYL